MKTLDREQCASALRDIKEQVDEAITSLSTGQLDEVSGAAGLIEVYAREVQGVIREANK